MPNHVRNIIKINHIPKDKVDYVLNRIACKYNHDGREDFIIDFDLIIPEPRLEHDCPKDCRVNSSSHVVKYEGREWFDWFEWHNQYWGTKWNAYDGYVIRKPTSLILVFSTAWACPAPIIRRLFTIFKDYPIEVRYADEGISENCGKIIYDPEDKSISEQTARDMTNPGNFAKYIWENY